MIFFRYTSNISFLSGRVGRSMEICRSNLPGLSNAWRCKLQSPATQITYLQHTWSSISTRFVEARMTTPSSWLIPASRLWWHNPPPPPLMHLFTYNTYHPFQLEVDWEYFPVHYFLLCQTWIWSNSLSICEFTEYLDTHKATQALIIINNHFWD